jgi:flavin reductase (DIM6/NTAB) family NADH-FMN oxidoreductase RutF
MKIKFGAVSLVYPIPIILAGANVNGKPNFATLGDCGIMGIRPPIVYVSLNHDHYTTQGILENGTYSINIPTTEILAVTDYCGIVSGKDVDKSNLFETFYGELGTAPLIEQCPVNLECRVIKEFAIQHRHIFVGEVVQAYVEEKFAREKDGRRVIAAMPLLDPIIYALDNQYYKIGEVIGVGYGEGKSFRRDAG